MQTRNQAVAMAAAKYKVEHEVLPTVDDIMKVTEYNRTQIYATDAYKDGKIVKAGAKATDEVTGSSVTQSEYFGKNSIQNSREKRRNKAEQAELDGLVEEQQEDEGSKFVNG